METELDGKNSLLLTETDFQAEILVTKLSKILRNRFNQFLYSLVHPDIGVWLAQGSSKKSRLHTDDRSKDMYNSAKAAHMVPAECSSLPKRRSAKASILLSWDIFINREILK